MPLEPRSRLGSYQIVSLLDRMATFHSTVGVF